MDSKPNFFQGQGIIKPVDREGKLLVLSSTCDMARKFREFVQCMVNHNHGAFLDPNADEKPVRPDEVYNRRTNGVYEAGDDKRIEDYLKRKRYWEMHGNAVVPSYLSMYPKNMFEELVIENVGSVYVNTQDNLFHMMQLTLNRYGGWSTVKGDRNYYELMKFPNFTTRPLVHTGIYTAKESRTERVGWGQMAHELGDEFYKDCLVARMKNWDVLAHLQQVFESDERMTFDQCKMTKLENDESSMTHVIQKLALTIVRNQRM